MGQQQSQTVNFDRVRTQDNQPSRQESATETTAKTKAIQVAYEESTIRSHVIKCAGRKT
jgi:hypothetical protein